jgi:hypothetical protein
MQNSRPRSSRRVTLISIVLVAVVVLSCNKDKINQNLSQTCYNGKLPQLRELGTKDRQHHQRPGGWLQLHHHQQRPADVEQRFRQGTQVQ